MYCRHTEGRRHSCVHVESINKLIPGAYKRAMERLTAALVSKSLGIDEDEDPEGFHEEIEALRDYYFHDEMNKAAIAKGLRRPGPGKRGEVRRG